MNRTTKQFKAEKKGEAPFFLPEGTAKLINGTYTPPIVLQLYREWSLTCFKKKKKFFFYSIERKKEKISYPSTKFRLPLIFV